MSLSAMDTGGFIAVCVSWVVIVLALALDLSGRRRRHPAFRWMGAGLLVMNTGAVLSNFARVRHWTGGPLAALDKLDLVDELLGLVPGDASSARWTVECSAVLSSAGLGP